jgi:ketosteroid isomerase-like protein
MVPMKRMILFLAVLVSGPALAQEPDRAQDRAAVENVLRQYRTAIERLDATGTEVLFAQDSQIFENGGVEGTYTNYLAHHLGPELGHFSAFRFSDVNVGITFEGPVALATETYTFRIERREGEPIERRGVTTSVLRRTDAGWRIVSMHGSSRAPRPPQRAN